MLAPLRLVDVGTGQLVACLAGLIAPSVGHTHNAAKLLPMPRLTNPGRTDGLGATPRNSAMTCAPDAAWVVPPNVVNGMPAVTVEGAHSVSVAGAVMSAVTTLLEHPGALA